MEHETATTLEKASRNSRWKGDGASYAAKHQFLTRNFQKVVACEHCGIGGAFEKRGTWSIQWAKKRDVTYSHSREDYIGLCRSCHRKYDMTDKELARLRSMSRNQSSEQLAKLAVKRRTIALTRPRDEYGHFTKKAT